jgi:hypothetical protein
MMPPAPFLQTLETTASQAAAAETVYRRESAARIKELERERSFAFRRLNLMRAVSEATARAESEELAVAGSLAILRAKLGWSSDSEARSATLTQFAPVAKAMFAGRGLAGDAPLLDAPPSDVSLPDTPPPDVLKALSAFEAWYEATHRSSFWTLFEQPIPETPLVDF